MTVFKYFLRNSLRLKSIMILYTIIFLVIAIFNAGGSTEKNVQSFQGVRPGIGIMDESNSSLSRELVSYVEKNSVSLASPETIEKARENIFLEAADAYIVIPKDFETRLRQGRPAVDMIYDNKDMAAHILESQLQKYLMLLKATQTPGGYDPARVEKAMESKTTVAFLDKAHDHKNTYREAWFRFYFNFLGYVIPAIYIGVIGLAMSDFQQEEVSKRIHSSAQSTLKTQIQTYLGQFVVASLVTICFIFLAIVIQKGNLADIPLTKYLINLGIFSLTILSFTFLINNLTSNKNVKNGLSIALSLGTAFISGVMIPQEFISGFTLQLARFFPTYYFVKINDLAEIQPNDFYTNLAIQGLFGLAFLVAGIYFAKTKRDRGRV